ncbi:tRNA pseudouridine(55) synthase TruB [Thermophagus sp. OGC60D27]|uniref:tRNA pseudouridine(55) synthase TruB n=1 Tax=Thermophagus sp. OGC60D27 TaxID=3458415 RepID=UPI004037E43E
MFEKKIVSDFSILSHPNEFLDGMVILVDKPIGWTSFDVVNKIRSRIRQILNIRKLKVGHAGTLDPLATGLVIVCIGKATKSINTFMADEKQYIARIKFGATTPSFDLETEIDRQYPVDHIHEDLIKQTLGQFYGEQEQIPPVFSAVKVDGKRAYQKARKGEEISLNARTVVFHEINMMNFQDVEADVFIRCSKGTYIRSFARDLGQALDSGAHLTDLRRTGIGKYSVNEAMKIEDFDNQCDELRKRWAEKGIIQYGKAMD